MSARPSIRSRNWRLNSTAGGFNCAANAACSHAFLISPSKHSFEMLLYIADERLYKPRANTEQDVIEAWAAKQNVMDWDAVLELPRHSFINHHHCTGQGFPCVLRTWPGKSFDAAGPSCANFLGEAARRSHISLTS